MDGNGQFDLVVLIWMMFLGIVFGAFVAYFTKTVLGNFVRKLMDEGASGPETARTLDELGYRGLSAFFVRRAMKPGASLSRYVNRSDSGQDCSSKRFTPQTRVYLPRDLFGAAEVRFEKKGTTLVTVLITVLVFAIVACACMIVIPALQKFAMDVYGDFTRRDPIGYTPAESDGESGSPAPYALE